jgi:Predicted acyltransferases
MKLKYVDSLRGMAILGVIIVHTSQWGCSIYTKGEALYPGFVNRIFEQGARGVQLFYVVSAFTLFLSYYERLKYADFNIKAFFIRRVFRVVPMYYLGILFFGFVTPLLLHKNIEVDIKSLLSNILLLNSVYPSQVIVPGGWTISVELLFYCMLPFLYKSILNVNRAIAFTIIAIMGSIVYDFCFFRVAQYDQYLDYFRFSSLPSQLPVFGFGILAFFVLCKKDISVKSILLLIIGAFALLQFTLNRFIPTHILFGVPFFLLILALSKTDILNFKPLVYLGKISFSAYFVHFAVLFWLNQYNLVDFCRVDTVFFALVNFCLRLAAVLLFVFLVSAPLYHFFEVPFQKFGNRLIKKLELR